MVSRILSKTNSLLTHAYNACIKDGINWQQTAKKKKYQRPARISFVLPSEAGSLVLDVKLEAVGDEVSAIAFAEVGGEATAIALDDPHSIMSFSLFSGRQM